MLRRVAPARRAARAARPTVCRLAMESKVKQCAIIEFLQKEGCGLSEIHKRLQVVYGDAAVDKSNVQRWMRKFQEGEMSTADKHRSGRPVASITNSNLQQTVQLVCEDCCITVRELVQYLSCGYNTIQTMLDMLGYRKICGIPLGRKGVVEETVPVPHRKLKGLQEGLLYSKDVILEFLVCWTCKKQNCLSSSKRPQTASSNNLSFCLPGLLLLVDWSSFLEEYKGVRRYFCCFSALALFAEVLICF